MNTKHNTDGEFQSCTVCGAVHVPCKVCGHGEEMHSRPDKISACVVTDSEGPCMCQNFLH